MESTVFLAELWGPALFAVGIGMFVSRSYYVKIYRDLEKGMLTVLLFSMAAIAAGVAQIQFHNVWNTFPQILISLLGWGLLVKGAVFAIAPNLMDAQGDWVVNSKLVPSIGVLVLLAGAYLTWFGFLA